MVEGKDDKAVRYVNSETGFGTGRIVKGVDCRMYVSVIPTSKKDIDNILLNIQFTSRVIYGYLLAL
jgi:hypothetical protein